MAGEGSRVGTFVKGKAGGMVPWNHPDADPTEAAAHQNNPVNAAPNGQKTFGMSSSSQYPAGQPQTQQQAVTGAVTVGSTPQAGQQTNVAGAFQNAMVQKLTGGGAPINAQNPAIAPAIQANQLAGQRSQERARNLAAERASAGGYNNSGAFDSQLFGLEQARGEQEAGFEGAMVRDLAKQQSQEILAALGLSGGALGQVAGQDLQRYGIDTDAALRREGLGAQTALGGRELDIRDRLGSGQLNLGLLSALLNNEQFGQRLGADLGMFGANLDAINYRSLLG